MKILALAATAALAVTAIPASAALLDIPVPTNTYITFNGADWAWASPCSPGGCGGSTQPIDLSYQSTQGWRLPTVAEMLLGPKAIDFVFRGANVPLGGSDANGTSFSAPPPGDAACAVAYFTSTASFNHCDWGDGDIDAVYNRWGNPQEPNVETWVIRGNVDGVVPEPATWAMLITGFGLVGFAARRRTTLTA